MTTMNTATAEWACYWTTAGDDAHVVSRHRTQGAAARAVARANAALHRRWVPVNEDGYPDD